MPPHALVVTGGHRFDEAAFDGLLARLASVTVERVDHPDAGDRLHPDRLDADVIVLYDMPGLRVRRGDPVEIVEPPAGVVEGWEALLAAGVPVVALHHSICSWPAWPRFAEIIGGRFHYAPGRLAGRTGRTPATETTSSRPSPWWRRAIPSAPDCRRPSR
jgi:hypothetical protein